MQFPENWKILPCYENTKKTMILDPENRSSSDPEVIKQWSNNSALINYAVHCKASGLVVVDVDVKHNGVEAWQALCEINGEPITRKHKTPRGGFHYFFKHKEGEQYKGEIQKGIDIRYNGYVLTPPSVISKTRYTVEHDIPIADLPDWLLEIMRKDVNKLQQSVGTQSLGLIEAKLLVDQLRNKDLTYLEWTEIGMALHYIDPSDDGLKVYLDLTHGKSYKEGDHDKAFQKWKGFSSDKDNLITDNTLIYICKHKGIDTSFITIQNFSVASAEAIFHKISGRYICTNKEQIVEYFNSIGLRYFTKSDDTNVIQFLKDGNFQMRTRRGMEDYFIAYYHEQVDPIDPVKSKLENAFQTWFKHADRNFIHDIVFTDQKVDENTINLYTGFPLFAHNKGKASYIMDLLSNFLVPDKMSRELLLDYLAHIVQKPFEKSSLVPVHITGEGAGKGTIYDIVMGTILGKYYLTLNKSKDLLNSFNSSQANKFSVFVDESNWSADKEQDDIMKRLTGSDKLEIEKKYQDRYTIDNPARYVIASNRIDAISISENNRRYVCLKAVQMNPTTQEQIANICDKIKGNRDEIEKFYNFLLERDITFFRPYKLPSFARDTNHEVMMARLDPTKEFIRYLYNQRIRFLEKDLGYSQKYLSQLFTEWAISNNLKFSRIVFGSEFRRFFFMTSKRKCVRSGNAVIWYEELNAKDFFIRCNEFFRFENDDAVAEDFLLTTVEEDF